MAILTDEDAISILNLESTDALLPLVRKNAERLCKQVMGWDPERSAKTEFYESTERGGGEHYWIGEWGSHPQIGGRTDVLQLKRKFVLATGLTVQEFSGAWMGQYDDTAWETLTLGDQYYLDLDTASMSESGHLIRLGAEWPKSRGSVKVTYTAGFTATELSGAMTGATDYTDASDLRLAVAMAVAKVYNEMKSQQRNTRTHAAGPISGERVADYSYQMEGTAVVALMGMSFALPPAVLQILNRYSNKYSLAI